MKEFFKYLFISVVTGVVVLFLRGWIAQEEWFVKRFGSNEQREALKNDNKKKINKDQNMSNSPIQAVDKKSKKSDVVPIKEQNSTKKSLNEILSPLQKKKSKLKIYEDLAKEKDPYAEYKLGYLYENGIETVKDSKKALFWYKRSASHNYSEAQYILGQIYENGYLGVNKSIKEALKWYKLALENGNIKAKEDIKRLEKLIIKDKNNILNSSKVLALKEFLSKFIEISMYNRVSIYLDFFKFPLINYFEDINVTKEEVREQRIEYIKNYPNRIYKLEKIKIVSKNRDNIIVEVKVNWEIYTSNIRKMGEKIYLIKLIFKDDRFYITSIIIKPD